MHNLGLVLAVVLFLMGWYFGTRAERTHLASLADDEQQYSYIKVSGERFLNPTAKQQLMQYWWWVVWSLPKTVLNWLWQVY